MEKNYTHLFYSFQLNRIPIKQGKKIQIKVQAENSNKAIEKDKLQANKKKKIISMLCRHTNRNIQKGK